MCVLVRTGLDPQLYLFVNPSLVLDFEWLVVDSCVNLEPDNAHRLVVDECDYVRMSPIAFPPGTDFVRIEPLPRVNLGVDLLCENVVMRLN